MGFPICPTDSFLQISQSMNQLEVVLKISERCNIDCTYCYMFNLGNEDYKNRPPYMSEQTVMAVARFLATGARALGIDTIVIILHGGEPLMMKKERFEALCCQLRDEISPFAKVRFALQTNAMLVDFEWIRIFARQKIDVGVSIDGPERVHNEFRMDRAGSSTFEKTVDGIRLLQAAARSDIISPPGALAVINPSYGPVEVYEYLVRDLGLKKVDFLLPIVRHDTSVEVEMGRYTNYLLGLLDCWFKNQDPDLDIRIVTNLLRFIYGGRRSFHSENGAVGRLPILTISSAGDLGPDDDLKLLGEFENLGNVHTTSLEDFLGSQDCVYLGRVSKSIPTDCSQCAWQNYCKGGSAYGLLVGRYSEARGFDNKSKYCEPLRAFHFELVKRLLNRGLTEAQLEAAFDFDNQPLEKCASISRPAKKAGRRFVAIQKM